MSLKTVLKTSPLTKDLYASLKRIKDEKIEKNKFDYHGVFVDRSKGEQYLCIVLAGYKDYLYSSVFSRIQKYSMDKMDICIVTSGKYDTVISELCEKNDWSYLSTKENNVSLVQNIAIKNHPKAKYIFKLDEDIFISDGYFTNMINAYNHAANGRYFPGVVAPLIPINGFCHVKVLEKLGLTSEYEKRFGELKCAAGHQRPIENSPEVAKFFWGEGDVVPNIDEMNRRFGQEPLAETAVPIRFSIGAIFFERSVWEAMGYFEVDRKTVSLGKDEVQLCTFCCIDSKPIVVSENVLVGHFSFGPQNEAMKEYYIHNKERFEV